MTLLQFRRFSVRPTGARQPRSIDTDAALNRLNEFAEDGHVEDALKIFKELDGRVRSDQVTMLHNTVVKAFARNSDVDGASAFTKQMDRKGISITSKGIGKLLA